MKFSIWIDVSPTHSETSLPPVYTFKPVVCPGNKLYKVNVEIAEPGVHTVIEGEAIEIKPEDESET